MLQLYANSTRRASWEVKLGYQVPKYAFSVPLESLYSDGGMVGCINAVVLRKYPMQVNEWSFFHCYLYDSHLFHVILHGI